MSTGTLAIGERRLPMRTGECKAGALLYRIVVLDIESWRPNYPDDAFAVVSELHTGRSDEPQLDGENPYSPRFRLSYSNRRDGETSLEGTLVDAGPRILVGEVERVAPPSDDDEYWWLDEPVKHFLVGLEDFQHAGTLRSLRKESTATALAWVVPIVTRAIEEDPNFSVTTTKPNGHVAATDLPYSEARYLELGGVSGGEVTVSVPPNERELRIRIRRFRHATEMTFQDLELSARREKLDLGDFGEVFVLFGAGGNELMVAIGVQSCSVFVDLGSFSMDRSWETPLRKAAARIVAALEEQCRGRASSDSRQTLD